MVNFLIKRLFLLTLTMFLVSVGVFLLSESSPGNIARNILGPDITPEQEASFVAQIGLDKPLHTRYLYWLLGSEWHASRLIGMPLKRITTEKGFDEWWAIREDGSLIQWKLRGNDLLAIVRTPNGISKEYLDNERWKTDEKGVSIFWGVNTQNRAVQWKRGEATEVWKFPRGSISWVKTTGGASEYIPLKKGFIRGDPGESLLTGRPVSQSLLIRFRNSMFLAGMVFVIVMPLAVLLGVIAGLREGSLRDRVLSIGGIMFSVIPEFATGIFLILIVAMWLKLVPGATVIPDKMPWERLDMLVLPFLTLALTELGYVLRITRASIVEVVQAPYVRTALLKGLPYWRVVFKHVLRNALLAPITVIMLHLRWLVGGLVVVEVVFSYPGLGTYLLEAALYKDVNALEAGTMIMVAVCVGAQLIADIIYMLLNPRIRY